MSICASAKTPAKETSNGKRRLGSRPIDEKQGGWGRRKELETQLQIGYLWERPFLALCKLCLSPREFVYPIKTPWTAQRNIEKGCGSWEMENCAVSVFMTNFRGKTDSQGTFHKRSLVIVGCCFSKKSGSGYLSRLVGRKISF
jgi:hypothetical protein